MLIVKRIGLGVLVLWLSTAIYLLLVDGRRIKKSLLRPTLEGLGKQLFAAVAEDDEKAKLKEQYDVFVYKAEKSEIPAQQIEQVAADILNLTKNDSVISSHDALGIFLPSAANASVPETQPMEPTVQINPHVNLMPDEKLDPEALADRLRQVQAFHDEYKKIARHNKDVRAFRTQFTFCADSGLRVLVQDEAKAKILNGQLLEMSKELKDLEKKRLVSWQQFHFVSGPHMETSARTITSIHKKTNEISAIQDSIVVHISTN
jgi:hypothetical protein